MLFFPMTLQIFLPGEPNMADSALELLVPSVSHVSRQSAFPIEPNMADSVLELLVPSVSEHVCRQIAALGARILADSALERLLVPSVSKHV